MNNMEERSLAYYLERYLDGQMTVDEWKTLQQMLELPENEHRLNELMDQQLQESTNIADEFPVVTDRILSALREKMMETASSAPVPSVHRIRFLRKWGWAAAAVLLLLAAGIYIWTPRQKDAIQVVQTTAIQAGKQGAILTLADGSQISLDTVHNGRVVMQGGVAARITNGRLAYEGGSNEVMYNKIATPKAREFQLVLPDGTMVWLNAASSIRYPTVFAGNERKVEITGEAYFEVAKHVKMPFVVNVNNSIEVQVLGTHFNVNAYENESAIMTTLLEGMVKVIKGGEQSVIRPGEQAQVKDHIHVAKDVNTDKVMAWKNGVFDFENTSLEEVMRQLERWYDIEVVYEKGVPDVALIGKVTKDVPLNGLLDNLRKLGVHYRMEGRRLIVLPG